MWCGGIEGLDLVKKKGYICFTLSNEKFGSRSCLNFIQLFFFIFYSAIFRDILYETFKTSFDSTPWDEPTNSDY